MKKIVFLAAEQPGSKNDHLYSVFQKKLFSGIKLKHQFNFQYIIGKSTLYATKSPLNVFFSFLL